MFATVQQIIAAGTPSGWTLCIIGLVGLFGIWRIYALQSVKMRELDISEGDTLRVAFVAEMKELRAEIASLRAENASLRTEVRSLHGVIDGMRRENLGAQTSAQRIVADMLPHSPEISRALENLGKIEGDAKP